MKLIIIGPFWGNKVTIEDVEFVPRVGEFVCLGAYPSPKVQMVVWNFKDNEVTITVE